MKLFTNNHHVLIILIVFFNILNRNIDGDGNNTEEPNNGNHVNNNYPSAPHNPFDEKLCKSLYFEDGARSIDFVLVWKCEPDDKLLEQKEEKRKIFVENLKNEGLELEHASVHDTFYFIKVI